MDLILARCRGKQANMFFSVLAPFSEYTPRIAICRCGRNGWRILVAVTLGALISTAPNAISQESRIVDRIIAVVDGMLITKSDIDSASAIMRLEMPTRETPEKTVSGTVLTRLIEQRLIQKEIQNYPGVEVAPEQVAEQIRNLDQKFRQTGGLPAMVSRWNLSMDEIEKVVLYQLRLAAFIDVRFRSFIRIEDEEIAKYYAETLPGVLKKGGVDQVPALDTVREQIRDILIEARLQLEQDRWIRELVKKADVQVFAESFSLNPQSREAPPAYIKP
jgi:peptidyl-prolyl cis-trans isomerase SurA